VDDALGLCEQAWKTCPAAEVAGVAVALLHSERATAEHRGRVQKWLEEALDKTAKALPLVLAAAEVHQLQGEDAEAIKLYRQVLDGEADNVVALNNLAWLLAHQDKPGEEALALIDKAIAQRGPIPQLLDTRAVVYLATGKDRHAVRDLEAATAAEPSGPRYFHLAQAYFRCGERRNAEQALKNARAANLTEEHLHAAERPAYQQLLRDLGQK
jgi:Tfp pilus assembly protein PilF